MFTEITSGETMDMECLERYDLDKKGYCMQAIQVRICPNSGHFTYHIRVFY